VVVAVAAFGILVVGAHAASAGTLEICKSGANGMTGKTFNFSVAPNAGSTIGTSVKPTGAGFTCTSVITLPGATSATVTESDPTGQSTETASITVIPSAREVAGTNNPAQRRVTVTLGTTTANETIVRFVNQAVGGTSATLKVCKTSETPSFVGRSFSFSVNGGPLVSTTANDAFGDPAFWSCRILGTFQAGSVVRVREAIPAGAEVNYIDTDPGTGLVDFNTNNCVTPTPTQLTCGEAFVRLDPGVTIVQYDDEPVALAGTGFIEICKNPPGFQDPAVTGFWHFTITDQDGNLVTTRDVLTGQCTTAIEVPAGIVNVQESARAGFQLTNVFTIPADALAGSNTINGTASLEVPVSATEDQEVQVNFVNEAIRTQLKVCKALGANSGVLVGQTFNFRVTNITDPDNPVFLGPVSVTAGSTTQCTIFGNVPAGTVVRVDEVFGPDNPNTLFDESGQFIRTNSPGTVTMGGSGTTANTVTITNTAFGQIEICKDAVAGLATQPTFNFRIDNGAMIAVPGNSCSNAVNVSVGNHTVTELNPGDFDVTAITVDPSGRRVGTLDLAGRSVTVNVPYGPNGETVVHYTNAIRTGSVKVCKTIPITSADTLAPAPNGRDYTFTVSIQTSPGNPGTFMQVPLTVHLAPGQLTNCSNFTGSIPVLQTDGKNTIVGVQEQASGGGFVVTDIVPTFTRALCSGTAPAPGPYPGANCIPGGKDLPTRNINFFLAPGPQYVTFYQRAG